MRKLLPIAVLASLLPLAGGSFAQTAQQPAAQAQAVQPISAQEFVRMAGQGNLAEIELGALAQQKAASQEVRDFGQRMVQDHSRLGQRMQEVVGQTPLEMPASPSEEMQQNLSRLSGLSGEDFDRDYMRTMIMEHRSDIRLFERAARTVDDPQIRGLAEEGLPILRQHLELATSIAPQLAAEMPQEQ